MEISGTKAEIKTISEPASAKEACPSSNSKPDNQAEWKEGGIIRGEIVDLRYDSVSIRLEPGQKVITGKLDGNIPLAIGQEARFQVTENQSEHLTLKYLPEDLKAPMDSTVGKALTAAGLPLSQRNKAIVQELLNNRMSVDTQSLQKLIKIALSNREASPLTLVLMQKNSIPMTPSNIRQFEAYQNGTHQLLNGIHTVIENISDLYHQMEFHDTREILEQNGKLLELLTGGTRSGNIPVTTEQPLSTLFRADELSLLGKALAQQINDASLPAEYKAVLLKQLSEGTITASELWKLLGQLGEAGAENADALPGKEAVYNSLSSALSDFLVHNDTDPALSGLFPDSNKNPAISAQAGGDVSQLARYIMDRLSLAPDAGTGDISGIGTGNASSDSTAPEALNMGSELNSVFNLKDRTAFMELLKGLPESVSLRNNMINGTVALREILTLIKEGLPHLKQNSASALLSSPLYQKLLESAFHERWTLPQDKLADKAAVTELYKNLSEDLEKLSELIKQSRDFPQASRLDEPVKNLQENVEFMKNLNETFTYLQLPVQFRNQDVHSDLYVFTRKNALRNGKDSLNVLLHLDMTNLGALNIHLHMDHNQVRAGFYPEKAGAGQLITQYMPELTQALEKKGYGFHATVETSYAKPDFTKDFIEQSVADHNITRYSFDIRT